MINMKLKLLAAAIALPTLASLGGCADTGYGCPLNDTKGYCASVQDAYMAAKKGGGDDQSVFAGKTPAEIHGKAANDANHPVQFTTLPSPPTGGNPVYQPGRPWRVWIAPWYDRRIKAMHGGSYVFFSTPSKWGYGTLNSPGVASGILGPIAPSDLGFTPGQQDAKASGGAKTQSQLGITQPQQSFNPHQ